MKEPCKNCWGSGYYADHDRNDPHENGCSNCPIKVQCEECRMDIDKINREMDEWIAEHGKISIREEKHGEEIDILDELDKLRLEITRLNQDLANLKEVIKTITKTN